MIEYNLTGDEAKEAMKRGAVVENSLDKSKFDLIYGNYRDINTGFLVPNKAYFSIREAKYKIVELTDCNL